MACNSTHEQAPLSNDIIESVLRHWGVGRAKELSAPPRKLCVTDNRSFLLFLLSLETLC